MFVYSFGIVYGAMALNQPTPNQLWYYLNNTKIALCILSLLFGLLFLYDFFRLRKNKLINNSEGAKNYKKYNKILLSFFVLCILISTILNFILHANIKSLYY